MLPDRQQVFKMRLENALTRTSLGHNANVTRLRMVVRPGEQLPYVVITFSTFPPMFSYFAGEFAVWTLPVAAALSAVSLLGVFFYRRRPDSLRSILGMYYSGLTTLMVSFLWATWWFRMLSGLRWLYEDYAGIYAAVWTILLGGLVPILLQRWGYLHDFYSQMRQHLPDGKLPAIVLYDFLTFRGLTNQWPPARIAIFAGAASSTTLAVIAIGGRDAVGYFWFLCALVLCPIMLAILAVRRWLQFKYLGRRDLIIV